MTLEQETEQMRAAGFTWDPARGYRRWTHFEAGITALRQPYMSDEQWDEHRAEQIAEVNARGR